MLTIPNFQFAFDLGAYDYSRSVLLLGGKYNWDTSTKFAPYFVFNVFDIRPEYRYYYRSHELAEIGGGKSRILKHLSPKNPKPWRAWYIGSYLDFGTFSLKPSEIGRQGYQGGIGISCGFEIPLYQYPKGAIDFELGASFGVLAAYYDSFRLNEHNFSWSIVGEQRSTVLPMVTELRAIFSWRLRSVKDKYNKTNPAISRYDIAISDIVTTFGTYDKASFDETLDPATLQRYRQSDSTYRADYIAFLDEARVNSELIISGAKTDKARTRRLNKKWKQLYKKLLHDFDKEQQAKLRDEKKSDRETLKEQNSEKKAALKQQKNLEKAERKEERKAKKKEQEEEQINEE